MPFRRVKQYGVEPLVRRCPKLTGLQLPHRRMGAQEDARAQYFEVSVEAPVVRFHRIERRQNAIFQSDKHSARNGQLIGPKPIRQAPHPQWRGPHSTFSCLPIWRWLSSILHLIHISFRYQRRYLLLFVGIEFQLEEVGLWIT